MSRCRNGLKDVIDSAVCSWRSCALRAATHHDCDQIVLVPRSGTITVASTLVIDKNLTIWVAVSRLAFLESVIEIDAIAMS